MAVTTPSTQTSGTLITDTMYNEIVNGLNQVLGMKHVGDTLANADAGLTIGWAVGDIVIKARSTDDGGVWLRCDNRSIGSGSSGASARANDDMESLFTLLWTNFTDSELPIFTSGGAGSTRGGSAAADWAANKRLQLPDLRGRAVVGMDDPTGANAANRMTNAQADILGGVQGSETHTLSIAEMPAHNHGGYEALSGGAGGDQWAGGGANLGTATTTQGSGSAHANVQPSIFLNYFIYTGN